MGNSKGFCRFRCEMITPSIYFFFAVGVRIFIRIYHIGTKNGDTARTVTDNGVGQVYYIIADLGQFAIICLLQDDTAKNIRPRSR